MADLLRTIHPGEILYEEFMRPRHLDQAALAGILGLPRRRIEAIVAGRQRIDAETDIRLARYLGLAEGFFLRLQMEHDLELARGRLGPPEGPAQRQEHRPPRAA